MRFPRGACQNADSDSVGLGGPQPTFPESSHVTVQGAGLTDFPGWPGGRIKMQTPPGHPSCFGSKPLPPGVLGCEVPFCARMPSSHRWATQSCKYPSTCQAWPPSGGPPGPCTSHHSAQGSAEGAHHWGHQTALDCVLLCHCGVHHRTTLSLTSSSAKWVQ